jgi:phosphatidate cytidylyltransferase
MLKTRLLTSFTLLAAFLLALFLLPDTLWAMLALAIVAIGIWEWASLGQFSAMGRNIYTGLTVLAGAFLVYADVVDLAYLRPLVLFWGILAATAFWLVISPIWLISRYQVKSRFVMALAGWMVMGPLWLAMVSLRNIDPRLLLGLLAVIWIADTAAYFTGKRFGKHKLAPLISPGKTWEGVIGAWVAVSLYALVLCVVFDFDYWLIAAVWGITVMSIIGDLLESLMKRQAKVKDSGNLLPGHGGMLDRIDGLTSSLPLAAFFIYFPIYYTTLMLYV